MIGLLRHRRGRLLAAVLLMLMVGIAPADAAISDDERGERIGSGDPARGAQRAADTGCTRCHARDQAAPRLDGQPAGYTLGQLARFDSGQRHHPLLGRDSAGLSAADREDIAAWFAASAAAAPAVALRDDDSASARLFLHGDRHREVIACQSCHGADGLGAVSGSDSYPLLAGQSADYLRRRLREWRAGPSNGAPPGVMNFVTRALGDAEIDALSVWLSQPPVIP